MLTAFRALCILVLLCAFAAAARADSWAGPQVKEVFSPSRDHFVRVTPGNSWGDTIGFAGAAKGAYATAEFYRRQPDRSYRLTQTVSLLNPVAPVDFFVSNDGRLVTIDNWHNRGYGKVVAVYDVQGNVLKAYALANLFSPAEIEAFQHSVSSIAWHEGPVYIDLDQRTLHMTIRSGSSLTVNFTTGGYYYCETRSSKFLCRDSNSDRRWRSHREVAPELY